MKKLLLLLTTISFLLAPLSAQAFDGARKGFILGLGAGFGSAKQTLSGGGLSVSNTESGIATSFKIGAGLNEQFLLYFSNRVVFFSVDGISGTFTQGMSAVAGSYYVTPAGPSFFFTGELGIGVLSHSDMDDSDSGFGIGLGAGYDFDNHVVLEAGFMRAAVGSEGGVDASITNFAVTVSWLGF